jgi:hypothetical protein
MNLMTKISLTRVLSEIKSITEALAAHSTIAAVSTNKIGRVVTENCTHEQFKLTSQSRFDAWAAQVERLVLLKTLRNKANVQVEVTVGGKQMTMDQAIAKKAMLAWQQSALANFKAQLQKAQLEVTKADADVQISVDKAVAAAVASNALTTEQSNVFKAMYEQSLGKQIAVGDNIKTSLEKLEKYITEFSNEIDYVLSEANANTHVEI